MKILDRRKAIEWLTMSLTTGLALFSESVSAQMPLSNSFEKKIRQSVCRWCYNDLELEDLCKVAKNLGLESVELLRPNEWAILKKYDLICGVGFAQPEGFGITKGFNRLEHHSILIPYYENVIKQAAESGLSQIICFSGNREGLDDELGLIHCAKGLKKLMPIAEKYRITLIMELLNSKIDHRDYQCDRTPWGVALVEMVGSERFKLLYDIYHMQIMEGDVIRTIKAYAQYIAHYHTAGVPGRNELDETQELNYPAIMRAIAETGFKGLVAQEFIPKQVDKVASLRKAIQLCNV